MNDIAKIAEIIKKNNSFAIAVHVNPDADCLGSSSALVIALRDLGKNASIVFDGIVPKRLSGFAKEEFFASPDDSYDVCIAVDVAATYMMGSVYERTFQKALVTCCLDHHGTNPGYADYSYIGADASAAGEIIFDFLNDYLNIKMTPEIAKCLYAAIASDSGSFQYSNTTNRTHAIASKLMEYDFNAPALMRDLFEKKSLNQLRLHSEVVSNLEFCYDGRVAIAVVDNALLEKHSMTFEQADDLASLPRSIEGVEIGLYVKVKGENEVKVSLRSNEYADVSLIAKNLGGGGHIRAAGVTLHMTKDDAIKTILEEIGKVM